MQEWLQGMSLLQSLAVLTLPVSRCCCQHILDLIAHSPATRAFQASAGELREALAARHALLLNTRYHSVDPGYLGTLLELVRLFHKRSCWWLFHKCSCSIRPDGPCVVED